MLPDCTGEYNNASALPGERNITLFTARLRPEKRREKQPVSGAGGGGWGRAEAIQREAQLPEQPEAVQHHLLLPPAVSELRISLTHQQAPSALKMSRIKFAT